MYRCAVGIAGFIYGSIGYGLSILTCIFGTAIHRFFPKLAARPALKLPKISPGRTTQGLKPRQSRSCSKAGAMRRSAPVIHKASQTLDSRVSASKPSVDNAQLRRVSSLESLDRRRSFVLVAPVITINHVDRVDNMSIKAPTVTIHPSPDRISEDNDNINYKLKRSFTLAHPPSLPNLPRRRPSPPADSANRSASTFRLNDLKRSWGSEKPKIYRSASSPHLMEFAQQDRCDLKDHSQNKVRPVLSGKSNKKSLKQDKRPSTAHSQFSSSRFFASFPKNIEKKRSQTISRTQPYDAPYFVPPPVPPIPSHDVVRAKETKRSATLPSDKPKKSERSSISPQRISLFGGERK